MAAKLTIDRYGDTHDIEVCYCNTLTSEHPDNSRFLLDCERWFGKRIKILTNFRFTDVDDVIAQTRYMSGPKGARCTTELKKWPRIQFAKPDDRHVFGYTANKRELKRIVDFELRNPELQLIWILRDLNVTKAHCLEMVRGAGIELPAMYKLGFRNNNCPGCLKASSPWYWDKVRTHFPEVFARRCRQSRELGVRLVEIKHHVRIFLDELPAGPFKAPRNENLSCGPECASPGGAA